MIPQLIRPLSEDIARDAAKFDLVQERIRKLGQAAVGRDLAAVDKFIAIKTSANRIVHDILRKARLEISRQSAEGLLAQPLVKWTMLEIEDADKNAMKELLALTGKRGQLRLLILAVPNNIRLSRAYDKRLRSAKRAHLRPGTCTKINQEVFRRSLNKVYSSEQMYDECTCPALKIYVGVAREFIKSFQVLPHTIGDANASHLFGVPLEEGYDCIWNLSNGLVLSLTIREAFHKGQIVIVPDVDSEEPNALKIIVLTATPEELEKRVHVGYSGGAGWLKLRKSVSLGDLDNLKLDFATSVRPGKRYLYLHMLLSLFRRKRAGLPGWESDREKVASRRLWGSPGTWLKESVVMAFGTEIGDVMDPDELGDLVEKRETPSQQDKTAVAALHYCYNMLLEEYNEDLWR